MVASGSAVDGSVDVASTIRTSAPSSPSKSPRKSRAKAKAKSSPASAFSPGLMAFKLVYTDSAPSEGPSTAPQNLIMETFFYAMPSSSGLVTQYQLPQKIELAAQLHAMIAEAKAGTLDTSRCIRACVRVKEADGSISEAEISLADGS
ncbi:hypothetical protein HGRIS_007153 [Hohenbuehelia grisea]|uniref:Uncharacterized protein n=1 Tax=Hohenbuehelia grisea TaxID=104357 RepID=A0ABR3JB75_9AGAR